MQAHARKVIAVQEIANVCSSSVLPASHFNLFCRIQMQKDEILHFGTKYGLPTPSHAPRPTGKGRDAVRSPCSSFVSSFVCHIPKSFAFLKVKQLFCAKNDREQILHRYFLRWGPVEGTADQHTAPARTVPWARHDLSPSPALLSLPKLFVTCRSQRLCAFFFSE